MLQFKNLFKVKPFSILTCLGIANTSLYSAGPQHPMIPLTKIPVFSFSKSSRGLKLAPSHLPSFTHYNLASELLDILEEKKIFTPTPIQDMVIKEWLKSPKHLVFAAQTGTGKTLAYVLPLIQKLKVQEIKAKAVLTQPNRPRAIIFVPSKELVMQTLAVIKDFCHIVKLRAIGLSGEDNYQREKQSLDDGTDILVTTIDKFQKHAARENVYISQCQYLIFDEMDTFMDSGFDEIIGALIERGVKMASKPQMVFLSSTFTERIRTILVSTLGKEDIGFRLLIDKKLHYNLSNLDHEFLHIDTLDKKEPLIKILNEFDPVMKRTNSSTIIFCNSIPSCQAIDYFLKDHGIVPF
jgi:ATP-dependent RNA helicase DDX28